MIFKQYYLGCLAHASYMIADESTKIAAVVDPQRDIQQYLKDADSQGLKIKYVFLTHFHADFVAGHLEMHQRTGAQICLGAEAKATYPFTALKEGDAVEFGDVRITIIETPGHTPEGISLAVYDLTKCDTTPHAVLTGDTLFIGDVGRPDLMASAGFSDVELAGKLYDSLHRKLLKLPDNTLVYPAHGAGSMCGRNLSKETVSTIGQQRSENYALQPMAKEEFIGLMTKGQPEAPAYFGYDAQLNKEEHVSLTETLHKSLKPITLETLLELQEGGAQVVDVRDPLEFAGGHLHGSFNIGLNGKFATWAGIILNPEDPIILITEQGREEEAITRLGRIGFDRVVGYLEGGMQALAARPELVQETLRITAAALAAELCTTHPPTVLDVRTEKEWEEGHIDHSLNIPLPHLMQRWQEVPKEQPLVVHCASGYRSSIAASLLENTKKVQAIDLIGGYEAWEKIWGRPGKSSKVECHV
ncbi:MBL fold metallo-hydrolase [Candidatus Nitronereus thalassa]|uniref:MBL fold metallo-hydrolase n=1 Tax=Candidatus Nitronereus thalassa TaxID=3020898 RepID=A0ABU3K7P2_9BACT|nr:MBL fold metallo-hydrolase [Candidatus Nitronereus thalassa]MDT7042395.1 MBL fold metallo-hydrolase [Candidatus Nitronereus thalassa]